MKKRPFSLLFALASLQACADAEPSGEGQTATEVGTACSQYLSCTTEANPSAAADVREAYGATSVCWEDENAAGQCEEECANALAELHQLYPSVATCDDGSELASSRILAAVATKRLDITGDDGAGGCNDDDFRSVEWELSLTDGEAFAADVTVNGHDPTLGDVSVWWWDAVPCTLDGLSFSCTLDSGAHDGTLDATLGEDGVSVTGQLAVVDECTFDLEG